MRDSEWELSNIQGAAGDVRPISSYGKRKGTLQALLLILLSFSKSSDKAAVFCFVVAVFFFFLLDPSEWFHSFSGWITLDKDENPLVLIITER